MVEKDGAEKEKASGAAKEKAGDIKVTASTAAKRAIKQQSAEAQPRRILSSKKNKDKKKKGTSEGAGKNRQEEVART